MKISFGSVEFQASNEINHLLFEDRLLDFSKQNLPFDFSPQKTPSFPLKYEEIDNLGTWQQYKDEIKAYYPYSSVSTRTDVFGKIWVIVGGTGYCHLYH